MASAAPALAGETPEATGLAGIWLRHLTSFFIPMVTLIFLVTGPHAWYVAALFIFPMMVAQQIDTSGRRERRNRPEALPAWPFDWIVYGLAAMQFWIVAETIRLFSVQGIFSLDMAMVFILVGGCSGFSIITAHELIHRRNPAEQWLGRLLLCTVLYEHFYTEHLRGHHSRVGTMEDPATARFGESYVAFWRRTGPAQFRSAWRLETKRLGDVDMPLRDARNLHNRVLHGLLIEWSAAFAVLAFFGLAPFAAYLLQALVAVRLLEAVNYFEHWGLQRRSRRVQPEDSWDTHSWFTYYGLTGLSRHADHHARPARPYQQLRVWDEAPLLPYGYLGMVDMVMEKNAEFQERASQELARRQLGPFAPEPAPEEAEAPLPPAIEAQQARARLEQAQAEYDGERSPGPIRRSLGKLPPLPRQLLLASALLIAVTLGIQWELAGEMSFPARLLLNTWIAAVFTASIATLRRMQVHLGNGALSWGLALGLLLVIGALTDWVI